MSSHGVGSNPQIDRVRERKSVPSSFESTGSGENRISINISAEGRIEVRKAYAVDEIVIDIGACMIWLTPDRANELRLMLDATIEARLRSIEEGSGKAGL